MRITRAATGLVVAFLLGAGCAGPSTPGPSASPGPPGSATPTSGPTATPSTGLPSATPPSVPPSAAPSPSRPALGACVLDERHAIKLPAKLAANRGFIGGLTVAGELLIDQRSLVGGVDTLSLYDPRSGAILPIASVDHRVSQIAGETGNADWLVWIEQGFSIMTVNWSIWAYDRHARTTHRVDGYVPSSTGEAPPSLIVQPSLAGDIVAWSASQRTAAGAYAMATFTADLRTGTVRKLADSSAFASTIDPATVDVALEVGRTSGGTIIAVPASIDLASGVVTKLTWLAPSLVSFAAASATAAVVIAAPPDKAGALVVHVLDRRTGATSAFSDETSPQWPVAGDGFVAWATDSDTLVLPDGAASPTNVATRPNAAWVTAAGPWLAWWSGPSNATSTPNVGHVTCPPAAY